MMTVYFAPGLAVEAVILEVAEFEMVEELVVHFQPFDEDHHICCLSAIGVPRL